MDPPPGSNNAIPVSVTWLHPQPLANDLYRMWGFADGTFYAVGQAGTIIYFDGSNVSIIETSIREDLRGIWATSPNDIYAAGFARVERIAQIPGVGLQHGGGFDSEFQPSL